jgi:YfiH family protein
MIRSKLLSQTAGVVHGFETTPNRRPEGALTVRQVHGKQVWVPTLAAEPVSADAICLAAQTDRPLSPVIAAVQTADCVPVLLASATHEGKTVCAAVHAGWRGLDQKILAETLAEMWRLGARPAHTVAAIGPHIRPCCYEVGPEVAAKFGKNVRYLDLGAIAQEQLLALELLPQNIEIIDVCTYCSPLGLQSYRRAQGKAGRQWSWIGLS